MKKLLVCVLGIQIVATCGLYAQEVSYTSFHATPLALNPAYTASANANIRANAVYRNTKEVSTDAVYHSFAVSADGRVWGKRNGSYIGIGGSVNKGAQENSVISSFSGLLSISYHKILRGGRAWRSWHGCELAAGVQGGYMQRNIDFQSLYFNIPSPVYYIGRVNTVNYYGVNAGVSFAQSLGRHFNYVIGLSANNINRPSDAVLQRQMDVVGLQRQLIGTVGANILLARRLVLRPAFIYTANAAKQYIVAGNEFKYSIGQPEKGNSVFCGIWYRTGDVLMATAGFDKGSFRVGLGYDYVVSTLNVGVRRGVELAATYVGRRHRRVQGVLHVTAFDGRVK